MRIKASLVYIEINEARIGTGAISSAFSDEIFTPYTPRMAEATKFFKRAQNVLAEVWKRGEVRPSVKVINGLNESSYVIVCKETNMRTIQLIVSINQKHLFIFKSSKRVFCFNNQFQRNKQHTETTGLFSAGFQCKTYQQ